jgi:hypothetical protein
MTFLLREDSSIPHEGCQYYAAKDGRRACAK